MVDAESSGSTGAAGGLFQGVYNLNLGMSVAGDSMWGMRVSGGGGGERQS